MSTPWTVACDTDRLTLDQRRQGRLTVTVTNTGARPELAMFEVVTDPAAQSWFTVTEPQRRIPPTSSAQFQVQAAVPATATAGRYQVQGRVYSLDSIPEETSVLSNRILVELTGPPAPRSRRRPWLLLIPALIVLIAVTAAVTFVLTRDDGSTAGGNSHSPTVVVPAAVGLSAQRAADSFTRAGLVPRVRYRQVPGGAGQVTQSIQAGLVVARGTLIDIVYSVTLSAPGITTPAAPSSTLTRVAADPVADRVSAIASALQVTWTQSEAFVTTWRVLVYQNICAQTSGKTPVKTDIYPSVDISTSVTVPVFTAIRYYTRPSGPLPRSCGNEFVRVAAVDDFGTLGPFSAPRQYGLATG